jgi:hypothetical protein
MWSWFATRVQASSKPVGQWTRTNFVANYICINGWWLLLADLLWHTGTTGGLASGAVLFLAVISICGLLFYAAPPDVCGRGRYPGDWCCNDHCPF